LAEIRRFFEDCILFLFILCSATWDSTYLKINVFVMLAKFS
jgi:hypothetical protein